MSRKNSENDAVHKSEPANAGVKTLIGNAAKFTEICEYINGILTSATGTNNFYTFTGGKESKRFVNAIKFYMTADNAEDIKIFLIGFMTGMRIANLKQMSSPF